MLDFAFRAHNPRDWPYGYGGSVNVPNVSELFNRQIMLPTGESYILVDYGTREGNRIGILLPMHNKDARVKALTSGDVPRLQAIEVTRQLAHYLMYLSCTTIKRTIIGYESS